MVIILACCKTPQRLALPERDKAAVTGEAFFKQIGAMNWREREPLIINEILTTKVSIIESATPSTTKSK